MHNLVVNHHYVRDDGKYHAITPHDLRRELRGLAKHYEFIDPEDLTTQTDASTCILTFDDGLLDHYLHVYPVLNEFGIRGIFFIPTEILIARRCTHVQLRHLLLDYLGETRFIQEVNARVKSQYYAIEEFHGTHGSRRDTPISRGAKMTLDYMDHQERYQLLTDIAEAHYVDLENAFTRTHLTSQNISEMLAAGMRFGAHGHTHQLLTTMNFLEKASELELCVRTFSDALELKPDYISYPSSGYDPMVLKISRHLGFRFGFTTIRGENRSLESPLELLRYDCMDDFVVRLREH